MSVECWLLFSSIALVATISPGPAVLLVTSHSLKYGPYRSVCTILGNVSELFIMSLCSVLGVSTVLLYSAIAYTVIKVLGAIYLISIGIKLWRNGIGVGDRDMSPGQKGKNQLTLFGQGGVVALTNPKAIAFTTALFPQFIDPTSPVFWQLFLLVTTFMSFSLLSLCRYAHLSHIARKSSRPFISSQVTGRIFGGLFIFSGAVLASTTN